MTESINLKLKLDSSDIQGLMGGKPAVGMGTIAGGVAGGMGIFSGIKYSLDKLVSSSPQLQGSIMMLQKSLEMLLRPIGDVIGMWIRPLAIKLLRFTTEHKDAAKTIGAVLGIGAVSIAGGIIAGNAIPAIAGLLGLGTAATAATTAGGAATTSLVVPAALSIATILFGGIITNLIGGGGMSTIVMGSIAAAMGIGLTLLAGGGLALAIPIALVSAGIAGLAIKTSKISEESWLKKTPFELFWNWITGAKEATSETDALNKAVSELPTDKKINIQVNTQYTQTGQPSIVSASGIDVYSALGGTKTASGGYVFAGKTHQEVVNIARGLAGYKNY